MNVRFQTVGCALARNVACQPATYLNPTLRTGPHLTRP